MKVWYDSYAKKNGNYFYVMHAELVKLFSGGLWRDNITKCGKKLLRTMKFLMKTQFNLEVSTEKFQTQTSSSGLKKSGGEKIKGRKSFVGIHSWKSLKVFSLKMNKALSLKR